MNSVRRAPPPAPMRMRCGVRTSRPQVIGIRGSGRLPSRRHRESAGQDGDWTPEPLCSGEASIARDQGAAESLSKCDVRGAAGSEVASELPHAIDQPDDRMPDHAQTAPRIDGCLRRCGIDPSADLISPQSAGNLGVNEMRGVELVAGDRPPGRPCVEQGRYRRRSIDDDHRDARADSIAPTISSASTPRSGRSPSSPGLSARRVASASSRTAVALIEAPCRAAGRWSLARTSSGTFLR